MDKAAVFLGSCILLFFVAIGLAYAVHPMAARNNAAAMVVSFQFLNDMQTHQYSQAQTLCSASYRDSVPVSTLQGDWEDVEKTNGAVRGFSVPWGVWDTILPSSVEASWWMRCAKGRGHIFLHLVPESGTWRVNSVHTYPW